MWHVVAAGATAGTGLSNEVVIAVVGLLVAVVTAIAGVTVALINSRGKGFDQHAEAEDVASIRERIAVLETRTDDHSKALLIGERRDDQVERYLDLDNPQWRHHGD